MPTSKLVINSTEWAEAPQQPDYASCGVLVVTQAHNLLTGNTERQSYSVSKNDVKVMCLRMERAMAKPDSDKKVKSTKS
ncbi:hypothetical protein JG687_00015966 [Phytophthora cactorum]|uniref:Ubiquitin-like protease family profile domain-containing protein n=1 Tax=Phytophthora cactorum TaxID=29920 RepID=A0A8T1TVG9_9STRA|nr:hypothetical protein JG687_00015966 [Phytophthora cactorum]